MRSETSLIQTIGRAARNVDGHVILYADSVTPSMRRAMDETSRRRSVQQAYNEAHGIVPHSIVKGIAEGLTISREAEPEEEQLPPDKREARIRLLRGQMQQAARELEFEEAARLRDAIKELTGEAQKASPKKSRPGTIGSARRSRGRGRK